VPTGGLFDVVTAPHYLGECVEWSGFAAMTGTAAGWAFAFWTFANLFPRAVAYKRWYREKFGDKYVIRRAMF
jgi:protein-S-isoprenylcysteine O-methyltransferase Ste14